MGLDGTPEELAEFIDTSGASPILHIDQASHPTMVSGFFDSYEVTAVPTFVVINDDGEVETISGWTEAGLRDDLEWARAS